MHHSQPNLYNVICARQLCVTKCRSRKWATVPSLSSVALLSQSFFCGRALPAKAPTSCNECTPADYPDANKRRLLFSFLSFLDRGSGVLFRVDAGVVDDAAKRGEKDRKKRGQNDGAD